MGLLHCSRRRLSSRWEAGKEEEMATGEITTLPSTPEDGGSGGFPPGNFKDPKRLYCKNGGFFLRIRSDGGVDGIREKNDPHSKYFQSPSSSSCFAQNTQSVFMFFLIRPKQEEKNHGRKKDVNFPAY